MKIKQLQKELRKNKISYAMLLRDDCHISYFTCDKDAFCMIIPAKRPAYVISPEMDYERCKKHSKVRVVKWKKGKRLFEFIKKREKGKTIGINMAKITILEHKAMKKTLKGKYSDISPILTKLRTTKTQKEIEIIKKGCKITDKIVQKCIQNFKKFKTEKDVEKFLRKEAEKHGGVSFDPVVASGKNASMPHAMPTNSKIKKGFFVMDFGIKYKGYCTDITRTIHVGKPKQKEIEVYNKVLRVQEECIKRAKKGAKTKELYKCAFDNLGEKFNHGLGHGIGIEIHELPNLTPYSEEVLEKGMIFTIEPGIYWPNKFGIRIEDDILIGKKTQILTKTTKKLIIIK